MPSAIKTIAGPISNPLKLGLVAFCVGLCGVTLGFAIDYSPNNPLSFVAFGLVALAVATGFFAIAWGVLTIFRHSKGPRTND